MSRDNVVVMFDKNISGVAMPSLELGAAKALRARKEERTVPYFRYSLKDSNYEVCANSLRLVYEGSRNCPAPRILQIGENTVIARVVASVNSVHCRRYIYSVE